MKILIALVVILFIVKIESHSFMKCVDWDFGSNSCAAYPRNYRFYEQQGDGFLFQRGKFTKPVATELGQSCGPAQRRVAPIFDLYSQKHPMGNFEQGQEICPQWPARNHANALRAGTVSFYLSNKMSENSLIENNQDQFFEHLIHSSPFGNCTKYYENTNNATCTSCFKLPSDISPGLYVLQFFWEFNPKEYYLTCADIIIKSGNGIRTHSGNNNLPPVQYETDNHHRQSPPPQLSDYELDRIESQRREKQRLHDKEVAEREREERQREMQLDLERVQKQKEAAAAAARKQKSSPTIFQHIMKNGRLEEGFSSASWGVHSKKLPGHYETKPIPGNVLYFKCSSSQACINTHGKETLNINILGWKDVVENVQINLVVKGAKLPKTVSLGDYMDESYDSSEYSTVKIPLSAFEGTLFNGVTISGYDDSNSDIIEVNNISLSN